MTAGHLTDYERKATAVLFTLIFLYEFYLSVLIFVNEAPTDFDDLGTMLLAGFAIAIAVAVLSVYVKMRLQARSPQKADFLSISSDSDQK